VAGIDEPDLVKTDGLTIYFSRDPGYGIYCIQFPCPQAFPQKQPAGVTAITAFPLSSLGIASDSIPERGEMLLVRDLKVLIILTHHSIVAYDVSDPSRPKQKWTNKLGERTFIVAARLKENRMYLITGTDLNPDLPCPIVPMTRGTTSISVPCYDIWAPITPVPVSVTYTVFSMNPMTGAQEDHVTYLGDSYNTTLAMFGDHLYLTYRMPSTYDTVLLDFYTTEQSALMSGSTQARIAEITACDISIPSKLNEVTLAIEKEILTAPASDQLKLRTELENRRTAYLDRRQRDIDRTMIARIHLPTLEIAATGTIPGHLLNQFSMDEYRDHLRVATTVGETWRGKTANDVYVLNQNLEIIGQIVDLGLTERIYSARFIGDRGYLVTFRQIDPFYVLDLSIPTSPEMVGELKIPGYSAYLEPISDHLVLGVGREGSQVKLSLFDVTKPRNPVEKSKYLLNELWTEVEGNHHAFLRDPKHNVFFIPGSKGGYVLSYTGDVLSLVATVSVPQVKRALFIEDMLYVVAQDQITVLDENSWKEIKTLSLP